MPTMWRVTAIEVGCDCCSYITQGWFESESQMLERFPDAYTNPNYEIDEDEYEEGDY